MTLIEIGGTVSSFRDKHDTIAGKVTICLKTSKRHPLSIKSAPMG